MVNIRGYAKKQLESTNKTFLDHNPNIEASDVKSMNECLKDLTNELWDDMTTLVDTSELMQDAEILNDVVH